MPFRNLANILVKSFEKQVMDDYYQILGVSSSVDADEIKRRYRFLAMAYHPDRFNDISAKAEAEKDMRRLNEAYDVLSNPEKRAAYDRNRVNVSRKQESNDDERRDEQFTHIEIYFEGLLNKWESIFDRPVYSSELDQITEHILSRFVWLLKHLYSSPENFSVQQHQHEINRALSLMLLLNMVLGAELDENPVPAKFTLQELQIFTGFSFFMRQRELLDLIQQRIIRLPIDMEQCNKELAGLALLFCDKALGIGKIQAKSGRQNVPFHGKSETHKKPNWRHDGKENNSFHSFCEGCGKNFPTEYLSFFQNIGGFFVRQSQSITGNLCAVCAEKYFWQFSGITFLFGWWGTVSFFLTPIYLIRNIWNYFQSWKLRSNIDGLWGIEWGWKVGFASLSLIAFFVIIINWNYSYIPPQNIYITATHNIIEVKMTATPRTIYNTATARSEPVVSSSSYWNCESWKNITPTDLGNNMCVYGNIYDAYWGEGTDIFYIRFSNEPNTIRLISNGYSYQVTKGDCAWTTGEIKIFNNTLPYIEVAKDELFKCP